MLDKMIFSTTFKKSSVTALVFFFTSYSFSQEISVQINPKCERFIGGVSALDRTKYFSVHDTGSDSDQTKFRNDYNVTGGRGFWGPYSFAKGKTKEVGVYPTYKNGNDNTKSVVQGLVRTEHPSSAFKDGLDINLAADWAVEYYKDFENDNGRPEFFEVMNEPFVHASDFYEGWSGAENDRIKFQMAKFYGEVAKKIHETPALKNMKVIGYSSAWPSMELNDFGHWEENMKMFMDEAGAQMHAFSTHLYDGINVVGQDTKRSGSNSEAILDMIETYSYKKWGVVKPHAITEYGAIEDGYGDDYSEIASSQTLRSINHILFNLLEREDRLVNSIPFITGKANWHINEANNYQPYGAVLYIPTNIGEPNPDGWRYSPRIHFYEVWKDVQGKRVQIKSENPDIQTHAFVHGNKMFVGLSNLDDTTHAVSLTMLSTIPGLQNVKIKALKIYDRQMPDMVIETVNEAPTSIDLIKDETVMLEYTFTNDIEFTNALRAKNYYANNNLEEIKENEKINYAFDNVSTGEGYGTLRMSLGRKHNVTKKPIVKVNGVLVEVPDNYKGYDQANRDDFFGMIEIPFPAYVLKENNTVTVEFPDTGGRISSMILSVELYDSPIGTMGIKSIGNSCPGASNGEIIFSPIKMGTYSATVKSGVFEKVVDFDSKHTISNLSKGIYSVSVSSTSDITYKESYEIVITSPEELSVISEIDESAKSVFFDLQGGINYTVSINDVVYEISENSVQLPLVSGSNYIKVKTDSECQGIFEKEIMIANEIKAYPNPFDDFIHIDLGLDSSKSAEVLIFDSSGSLVGKTINSCLNGKLVLNGEGFKAGMYVINIKTNEKSYHTKLMK
jgi:hypothetical protein